MARPVTEPHWQDDLVTLYHGDCLDVLRELPDSSIDAVITDPPYGLEFMGAHWDGQVPGVTYWAKCLRVAKPGAYLAAFGGTRTFHRLAVAIEDAGWEMQDAIGAPTLLAWVRGQGFPKGKNQLKPAWEPIFLARKPFKGSIAKNVLVHGTGAMNIDATRVVTSESTSRPRGTFPHSDDAWGNGRPNEVSETHPGGRWPANVLLSHAPECHDPGECAPGCPVAELDAQSGMLTTRKPGQVRHRSVATSVSMAGDLGVIDRAEVANGDTGGASRFFPSFRYQAKAPSSERPRIDGKGWPTVKPQGICRWLAKLLCPPDGTILDPFAGTMAMGQAARDEGFNSIMIERDEFAFRLGCQRLGLDHTLEAV